MRAGFFFSTKQWHWLTYALWARKQGKRHLVRCWSDHREMSFGTLKSAKFSAKLFTEGVCGQTRRESLKLQEPELVEEIEIDGPTKTAKV